MQPGSRCRITTLCWLLLLLLPAATPGRAAEVTWLYEALVPVADQSAAARRDAARAGLLQVLTRVTGLTSIPRDEAVDGALSAPDQYFNQFVFERAEPEAPSPQGLEQPGQQDGRADAAPGLLLRIQFVPSLVLRLVREAGLPIWRSERPSVIAWLVADDGTGRRILASDSEHPVIDGLKDRAWDRGVPLQLPLMDLADQLLVEPAAVWGRLSQALVPASERYEADIILIGRLQLQSDGLWATSWEFWVEGEVQTLDEAGRPPRELGAAAVELLADDLVRRYAVLNEGIRTLRLAVSSVRGPADYASLLRYLTRLEFVDDVQVTHVEGNRLDLAVRTTADVEQLMALFRVDGLLFPDQLGRQGGSEVDLVWRQR